MKRPPLDSTTYYSVLSELMHARAEGLHPVEHLNDSGWLLTPQEEKRIKLETLSFVLTEMGRFRPAEFLRRVVKNGASGTPADMYAAVQDWLRAHIENLKENG